LEKERKMNKLRLLMCAVLLLGLTSSIVFADTYDLVAGRDHEKVGTVEITLDGCELTVEYSVDYPWVLTDTHLHVADAWQDIPQTKKGNAIPGQFDFSGENPFVIDLDDLGLCPAPATLYIGVHGVVEEPCFDICAPDLPESVTVVVAEPPPLCNDDDQAPWYPPTSDAYYLPQIIISGGTILDGTYGGWCLSRDLDIDVGEYPSGVFSSCDLEGLAPYADIINLETLGCVNWIMNNIVVDGDPYTYSDVQAAIWILQGQSGEEGNCIEPDVDNVDAILAALPEECDYIPSCGGVIGIVIIPDEIEGDQPQPMIIPWPIPCCDETIWGLGLDFPGNDWSMYLVFPQPD
jgi:hypothetical protein